MNDTEDPNKKAKDLQEKFAAAMNPVKPTGQVLSMKEFLLGRIMSHQTQAQEYLDQAKKLDSSGDVNKCPFAAPLIAKMNSELAAAARIKEQVQFIIIRELEEEAKTVKTPAQIPTAQPFQMRPGMNWNMGPKPTNIG